MNSNRSAKLGVVLLLAVAGCTGNPAVTPTGTATPAATTAGPATSAPTTGKTVTVSMTDFKLELSLTTFTPGEYVFVAEQKGQRPHALSIKGPGVEASSTQTIQPGGPSQQLRVTLQAGTYEIWCPVGNHKAQGMVTTITVA